MGTKPDGDASQAAGDLGDVNLLIELDRLDVSAVLTRGLAPSVSQDFELVDGAIAEIIQTTIFDWVNAQLLEAGLTCADLKTVDVEGYTDERTAAILEEQLPMILGPSSTKTFMLDTEV